MVSNDESSRPVEEEAARFKKFLRSNLFEYYFTSNLINSVWFNRQLATSNWQQATGNSLIEDVQNRGCTLRFQGVTRN